MRKNTLTLSGVLLLLISNFAMAEEICSLDYPSKGSLGYMVTSVRSQTSSTCLNNTFYTIVLPSTSGSVTTICDQSSPYIKSQFVTTAKGPMSEIGGIDKCATGVGNWGYYKKISTVGSSNSLSVCDGSNFPPGWIITSILTDAFNMDVCSSPGESIPRYSIVKATAASYPTVCDKGLPVPIGYIVTQRSTSSTCKQSSVTTNPGPTYSITSNPANGSQMCEGAGSVPNNFVITRIFSTSQCAYNGSGTGTAYIITSNFTSNMWICEGTYGSIIPSGFVLTDRENITNCAVSGTGPAYRLQVPISTGITICSPSTIPPNYVITGVDNYAQCGVGTSSGPGQVIKVASANDVVCSPSPIPVGWGFVTSQQYPQCGVGTASGYGYQIAPIADNSIVCEGSSIPTGMVITAANGGFTQCSGSGIGYTVKFPNATGETNVCTPTAIPAGYVITRRNDAYQCNTTVSKGFTIARPSTTATTFICGDSPIPNSYSVTSSQATTICGTTVPNGYVISLITGNGPYQLCNGTTVPSGYIIVARSNNLPQCTGSLGSGGFTIEKPKLTGMSEVCDGSPIPAGYVVVAAFTKASCATSINSDAAYRIQQPFATGVTNICNVTGIPIPPGYTVIGAGNASCGSWQSVAIQPTSAPAVIPTTFTVVEPDIGPSDVPGITYDCSNSGAAPGFVLSELQNSTTCPP